MVHFLDAVIKPAKFLGVSFFSKEANKSLKKFAQNQGGEEFVKRLGSRLVSGK